MRTSLHSGKPPASFDEVLSMRLRGAYGLTPSDLCVESSNVRVYGFLNDDGEVYRTVSTYNRSEQCFVSEIVHALQLVPAKSSESDFDRLCRSCYRKRAD